MGRTRGTVGAAGIVLVMMLVWPAVLRAQDSVQAAQTLYAAAAYDEALAVLDRLQSNGIPPVEARQVQENRALCLLALGRIDDANTAIAAVVTADPLYRPDEATASPRVRAAYRDVRSRLLPGIIEGRYREGEMLPSVRAFAAEQGANPLTVAKAYSQFQADGLIDVQRGVGMFVTSGAAERLRESERRRFIEEDWPAIRARMERLGLDPAALLHEA